MDNVRTLRELSNSCFCEDKWLAIINTLNSFLLKLRMPRSTPYLRNNLSLIFNPKSLERISPVTRFETVYTLRNSFIVPKTIINERVKIESPIFPATTPTANDDQSSGRDWWTAVRSLEDSIKLFPVMGERYKRNEWRRRSDTRYVRVTVHRENTSQMRFERCKRERGDDTLDSARIYLFFSQKFRSRSLFFVMKKYRDKADANCVTLIVSYRTSEVFQNDYCLDTETITEGRMWRENLGRKEIYRNK